MHIRGSIQVQKELQLLNPGGTTPADGRIASSDAEGNLRWSHLTLPALNLDITYPEAGIIVAYENKVYYSLVPNAEGTHIVDPGVWKELTAAAPDQDALTQDQKDAIAASVEPSAGNAYVTKKEVQNLIIKGSETVANILTKSPLTINNLWLATTAGLDSLGNAVSAGDGLTSTGTQWINIGAIRGPVSFADAPVDGKVYGRKNTQWQEVIHQDIAGKEDIINKGVALGYVSLNGVAKVAAEFLDIVNNLTTGGTASILSAEQGKVLKQQIDAITVMLASDDVNLDTVQELVNALKELPTILVDDLTTGGVTKALTAEQGVVLMDLINTRQDNFVRVLTILESDLSGLGSMEEKICAYILALPEAERTILETDSKWNIVIDTTPPQPAIITGVFSISSNNNAPLCDNTPSFIMQNAYGDGVNLGDVLYTDFERTTILPTGTYYKAEGNLNIVDGVVTYFECAPVLMG
jgi:hypothetical protein